MNQYSKRRRLGRLGAIGIAAALVLTGCAANGGGDGEDARGGTLTLITNAAPLSLDPAKANSGPPNPFVDLAYTTLIHRTSDGGFVPQLAESFDYVGEGNVAFQIGLRDDVNFSDGTPLDAAAVKASLEYFQTADGPFSRTASAVIDRIETPDELTVVVYFTAPQPDAPLSFAEGGGWGAIINPAVIASDPDSLGTSTAGAGAYTLDSEATIQGSSYVYVPSPDFFDPELQRWDEVVIRVISDPNAAFQAVQTGTNTWGAGILPQVEAAEAAGLTVETSFPAVVSLYILDRNGELVPALGDERVRQALNFAVDRDAIAQLMSGAPNAQIISEGFIGYSEEAAAFYSYDPERALELLSEAGYADGFAFRSIVGTFDPLALPVAQAIADQLSRVGVEMEIVTAPTFPDFASGQGTKEYSASVQPWGTASMYLVGQQLVLPTGVVNPWNTSDDELTALMDAGSRQTGDEAIATWEQLSLAVTEKAWYVPVVTVGTPFFGTPGLDVLGDTIGWPNVLYF